MAKRNIQEALNAKEDAATVRKLQRQVNNLQAKNRTLEWTCKHAEQELDAALARADYIENARPLKPIQIARSKYIKPSGDATAIIACSDWHFEERVDPKTVNGFNEHNPDIASKKIKTTFEHSVELIEAERRMSNIKDIVLALMGDFITGYIHPELMESNYYSPVEAMHYVEDHIAGGIDFLLKHSGCQSIIVPCVVGNHGRTTEKMRVSTSSKNSYEWGGYKHLERMYRNEPRVIWKVEEGYHNYVDVQGKLVRIHHGEAFKYNGGIQGPSVPILRKVASWDQQKTAWMDLCGHLHIHEVIRGGKVVLNGPLIGYGAYGEKAVGGKCPATQTLIVVDKKYDRHTCAKEIFCT